MLKFKIISFFLLLALCGLQTAGAQSASVSPESVNTSAQSVSISKDSVNAGAQFVAINTDSIYANLQHLTVAIGPRPMGSANEREALQWTARRFQGFGADTAYVMPVTHSHNANTTSGVAVGIFNGRSDSLIVIGSHIDSDFIENQGANDDASGTAVMIELARVWAGAEPRYTLLFAAFGGEESGLVGSRWFVEHFERIDRVALMLQIDMAGSDDPLIPFIDTKDHQAPQWLVKDAYAIDRGLGYNSLDYPTHFFSINSVLGGAGSDHEPFLLKKIPAIDFTAGVVSSPIHTINDRIDFISKPALERSARLVNGLLQKYDAQGIPGERIGKYMLWQLSGETYFVPVWLLYVVIGLALLLGALAFMRARAKRLRIEGAERVRFSGSKLFFMMTVIALFTFLGEAAMQLIKGLRYPWFLHLEDYLMLAAICAFAGFWVALRLAKNWRFSPDPYVYAKRGLLPLWLLTILFLIVHPRLALYPALTLLLFSVAVFAPGTLLKTVFTLAAPVPMFLLMFFEIFVFGARNAPRSLAQYQGFTPALIYTAILTLLLLIWYVPSLYMFAYTYAHGQRVLSWLRVLRQPAVGLLLTLALFAYGGYLSAFPAYNEQWRATIRATAHYEQNTQAGKFELRGDEYFREVEVRSDTFEHQYDDRIHRRELPLRFSADWLSVSGTQIADSSDTTLIKVDWQLASAKPWYEVKVQLRSDTLDLAILDTNLKYFKSKNAAGESINFRWFAEPEDTLRLHANFKLSPGAKMVRNVTAIYAEPPVPLTVTAKYADVIYRTEVVQQDTLEIAR
ncbi:M28 family peptidase [candidate division KSB1 bacterium]|nr:M28 family peptidase [candidate division KSB1 bacterium]